MTLYCNTPVASPENSSFLINVKELTIQTSAVFFLQKSLKVRFYTLMPPFNGSLNYL